MMANFEVHKGYISYYGLVVQDGVNEHGEDLHEIEICVDEIGQNKCIEFVTVGDSVFCLRYHSGDRLFYPMSNLINIYQGD